MLQCNLKSRVHPWSSLSRSLLHMVYLEQLKVRFDLMDELQLVGVVENDGPVGNECAIENCKLQCP